jgi:hypothetical protein
MLLLMSYLQFNVIYSLFLHLNRFCVTRTEHPKRYPHVTGLQHSCSPWTLVIPPHYIWRSNNYLSQIQQAQVMGHLERRVLEVNRKRIKVVKPGSKTSFPSTEVRGTYAPPFHVSYSLKSSRYNLLPLLRSYCIHVLGYRV